MLFSDLSALRLLVAQSFGEGAKSLLNNEDVCRNILAKVMEDRDQEIRAEIWLTDYVNRLNSQELRILQGLDFVPHEVLRLCPRLKSKGLKYANAKKLWVDAIPTEPNLPLVRRLYELRVSVPHHPLFHTDGPICGAVPAIDGLSMALHKEYILGGEKRYWLNAEKSLLEIFNKHKSWTPNERAECRANYMAIEASSYYSLIFKELRSYVF
jgi:hypothetical protein